MCVCVCTCVYVVMCAYLAADARMRAELSARVLMIVYGYISDTKPLSYGCVIYV